MFWNVGTHQTYNIGTFNTTLFLHLSASTGKWSFVQALNGISHPPMCAPTSSPSAAPSSIADTAVPSMSPSVIPSASPSVNDTCLLIQLQKHCKSRDWSGAMFSLSGPNDYYMSQGVTVNSAPVSRIYECPKAEGLYALTVYSNSSIEKIPQSVYTSVSYMRRYKRPLYAKLLQ